MILYGSGMSDSNEHSPDNLPLIVAGGAGGRIKGNRHLKVAETPMSNLLLTVADTFGAPLESFGSSTGRFAL